MLALIFNDQEKVGKIMKRLKTFLLYALVIAAFWFLSDFLIYMALHGSYQHIESKVLVETPNINVADSKATYINGYVKGNVYNNTDQTIHNQYIKIDFYSPRNVNLGMKYVKIENLDPQKSMDFEMWFKYTDVQYCNITVTDDVSSVPEEAFISDETKYYLVLGSLFLLYFL